MSPSHRLIVAFLVSALLASSSAEAQLPRDPVQRARVIAEIFAANARQLTVFDRQGKTLTTIGSRDMYGQPVLSPDGSRLVVTKADLDKETNDLWVLDVATGKATQLTSSQSREGAASPVWSPDGSQLAYVALRGGRFAIYRRGAAAETPEELVYQGETPMALTDWSKDGRFLAYSFSDLSGGALYVLPLTSDQERKPIEILRSKSQINNARLSPDGRFIAYVSNESGRNEIYVRRFDATAGTAPTTTDAVWRISDQGTRGFAAWRSDGKQFYYVAADQGLMAVDVEADGTAPFGTARLLFRAPETTPIGAGVMNMSIDGQRVVIAVPPPQLRQLTMFDRQGKIISTFGPPGLYVQPGVSPDGTRVVVMRDDPQTAYRDIWVYDVATGNGTAITNDPFPENAPIWSPDGKYVAYVSTRESYAGIYRKPADGSGQEELLFRYTPGAVMVLTDWSTDGKFLTFNSGALLLVALDTPKPALERQGIEWLREEYDVAQGRFSPDGRYLAFLSNEADGETMQVHVRPFDASKPEAPAGPGIQVSKTGALGMIFWRHDAKEMYFLTRDWEVMAVDVATTPTFQAGTPTRLFKLPRPMPGNPGQWKNVTRDGQRFVFAVPTSPQPSTR